MMNDLTSHRKQVWLAAAIVGLGLTACKGSMRPVNTSDNEVSALALCAQADRLFSTQVWPTIGASKCLSCHDIEHTPNSPFVLTGDKSASAADRNRLAFTNTAAVQRSDGSLLLLKAANRVPHAGGAVLVPGTAEYAALAAYVERTKKCTGASCRPSTTTARIRRLTRSEYDTSITALLLKPNALPGLSFDPDDSVNGFHNNAEMLRVGGSLADQYGAAAESLATTSLSSMGDCVMSTGTIDARGDTFVRCMGRRAFRRSLTSEEATELKAVFDVGANETTGRTFDAGARLVITALLQTPSFLYVTELGTDGQNPTRLTPHETASQLSYLLTGGPPDADLMAAADSNLLATPTQLEAQAKRLIGSPAHQDVVVEFVKEWLEVEGVDGLMKNNAVYPQFTTTIAQLMSHETDDYVKAILSEGNGTFKTLMTAPWTVVDSVLGGYYGIAGGTAGVARKANLPTGQRMGILTQGAVMSKHAGSDQSSPIRRGKLFRERVLCQPLPAPPKQLVIKPPAQDAATTTRARFTEHSSSPSCYGCHSFIDPPGFLFENFDGAGAYRQKDNGFQVDATGEMTATTTLNGKYQNIVDLTPKLADSNEAQSCFVEMMMQFATARKVTSDECGLQDAKAAFQSSGTAIAEPLLSYIRSDAFVTRVKGTP